MARKFARWANEHIDEVFKARVTATDPFFKAELHDTLQGARFLITHSMDAALFDDVKVRIDKVDIAKAKIYGSIVAIIEKD